MFRKLSPKSFIAIGAAFLATVMTYLLVGLLASKSSYAYTLFYERSWIQPTTTFCFWLTMAILTLRLRAAQDEQAAYERAKEILNFRGTDETGNWTWEDAETVRGKFTQAEDEPHHDSLAFKRISHALDRLRKTQSTSAFEDYFRTRSEIDASELETGYAYVRYLVWLIPTLGFIGTVMGIGVGIASFAGIIQTSTDFKAIQKALPIVTGSLGTAFDTTLLALGLSALAVFYLAFVLKRQEQLLEEIDHFCFDEVCALFRAHSTESAEIVLALSQEVRRIIERNDGNRADLQHTIRSELPRLTTSLEAHLQNIAHFTAQLVPPADTGRTASSATAPPPGTLYETVAELSRVVGQMAARQQALAAEINGLAAAQRQANTGLLSARQDELGRISAQLESIAQTLERLTPKPSATPASS
jgi:biopolymer transport protein ExbB/TolQ